MKIILVIILMSGVLSVNGQADSLVMAAEEVPVKFYAAIESKTEKYKERVNQKTLKTLKKLCKWENKIHVLLNKANPGAAAKLFSNNQLSFKILLEKYQSMDASLNQAKASYDGYRDKLVTGIKCIERNLDSGNSKNLTLIKSSRKKLEAVESDISRSETMERFIKERKKALVEEAIKSLKQNKYLKKINQEAFYYSEQLASYKKIFSEPDKIEKMVWQKLNSLPAFQEFVQKNSALAGIFKPLGIGGGSGGPATVPIVNGLNSRAELQGFISTTIPAMQDKDLNQIISSKLEQPEMAEQLQILEGLKKDKKEDSLNKVLKLKKNDQQHKSFVQRLEYGFDLQFARSASYLPSSVKTGLKLGYKINDKSSAGIGISYILGLGKGWNAIRLTHEGLGYRSYVKWALGKKTDLQGGFEGNFMSSFKKINELKDKIKWQQSALLGISRKYQVNKKLKGNMQVLFDLLYQQHIPVQQPIVFRMGYDLNR